MSVAASFAASAAGSSAAAASAPSASVTSAAMLPMHNPVVIGSAVPSLGLGGMVQALVGLLVVIAAVLVCGWLARRFGLQGGRQQGLIKVLSTASLGTREKVVLVEVADTWLVLGVGGGNVRALHTLPAGQRYESGTAALDEASAQEKTGQGQPAHPTQPTQPPSFQSALIKQLRARLALPDKE